MKKTEIKEQWVIVQGGLSGVRITVGPFDSIEQAEDETRPYSSDQWIIVPLLKPSRGRHED